MNSIACLRPFSWAKYWSQMGHDVTVLTCSGGKTSTYQIIEHNYSFSVLNVENQVYSFFIRVFQWFQGSDATVVESVNAGGNQSALGRFMKLLMDRQHDCRMPHIHDFWWYFAKKKIKGRNWDLVVSTYAPPVSHFVARTIKRQGITKCWIADFRDLWIEHSVAKGIFPFTLIEKWLEKKCVTDADIVTTVSEPLADILRKKYPGKRIETVSNGFDQDDLVEIGDHGIFLDNKIRLVYTGTVYPGTRDPSPLFCAIRQIADHPYLKDLLGQFEVVFAGGNTANIDPLIDRYKVREWVSLYGNLPRSDALLMQRDAHVLIFLEHDDPKMDGILTGKLFEYLNSWTEIWGIGITDRMESGRLILASKTGRLFGTDSQEIRYALVDLLESGLKKQISPNSEIIEQFDRKLLAKKMLALAEDQLSKQGRKEKRVVD